MWNPSAGLLPFTLLVFLCWSVACGEHRLLPITALVGSFVIQLQLTYLLPSLGLLLIALAGLIASRIAWRALARREHPPKGDPAGGRPPDRHGRGSDSAGATPRVRWWALAARARRGRLLDAAGNRPADRIARQSDGRREDGDGEHAQARRVRRLARGRARDRPSAVVADEPALTLAAEVRSTQRPRLASDDLLTGDARRAARGRAARLVPPASRGVVGRPDRPRAVRRPGGQRRFYAEHPPAGGHPRLHAVVGLAGRHVRVADPRLRDREHARTAGSPDSRLPRRSAPRSPRSPWPAWRSWRPPWRAASPRTTTCRSTVRSVRCTPRWTAVSRRGARSDFSARSATKPSGSKWPLASRSGAGASIRSRPAPTRGSAAGMSCRARSYDCTVDVKDGNASPGHRSALLARIVFSPGPQRFPISVWVSPAGCPRGGRARAPANPRQARVAARREGP